MGITLYGAPPCCAALGGLPQFRGALMKQEKRVKSERVEQFGSGYSQEEGTAVERERQWRL